MHRAVCLTDQSCLSVHWAPHSWQARGAIKWAIGWHTMLILKPRVNDSTKHISYRQTQTDLLYSLNLCDVSVWNVVCIETEWWPEEWVRGFVAVYSNTIRFQGGRIKRGRGRHSKRRWRIKVIEGTPFPMACGLVAVYGTASVFCVCVR